MPQYAILLYAPTPADWMKMPTEELEDLGTGATSLYWHFENKDELLDSVFDRVIGEIELPAPDPSRWQEQVKDVARGARQVMKAHRDKETIVHGAETSNP